MSYQLAPDAGILVVDGETTIRLGNLQLRTTLSAPAARELFRLAHEGFSTQAEAVQRLVAAGLQPDLASRTVAELLGAGVLVPADNLRWARAFHRQSGHGRSAARPGPRRSIIGPVDSGSTAARLADPLGALLGRRHSIRSFTGRPLTEADLAALLWAGFGMTDGPHRTVPSAGGLGAVRPVVAATRVTGLDPGLHRLVDGRLERYASLPARLPELFATGHVDYDSCSAVILLVVGLSRLGDAYAELGYRFGLLEAGHCAQNVLLAAEALQQGAVPVGALDDDVAQTALGLDETELVVYAVVLGSHG